MHIFPMVKFRRTKSLSTENERAKGRGSSSPEVSFSQDLELISFKSLEPLELCFPPWKTLIAMSLTVSLRKIGVMNNDYFFNSYLSDESSLPQEVTLPFPSLFLFFVFPSGKGVALCGNFCTFILCLSSIPFPPDQLSLPIFVLLCTFLYP